MSSFYVKLRELVAAASTRAEVQERIIPIINLWQLVHSVVSSQQIHAIQPKLDG